jgi:ribosomal protein S4
VFYYAVHIASPKKKVKKWSNYGLKMIYYRKISQFFGFKKVSKFLSFYSQSKSFWGNNQSLAFLLLEGRLQNILFRSNFFDSMYFLKRFIEVGNVYINNRQITNCSHVVTLNQIISINKKYFKYIYFYIKYRLKKRKLLLNFPPYMEVDYKLFTVMLIRPPSFNELTKPASFDLYTKFITIHK